MTVNFCDICGKNLSSTVEDLFRSRKYIMKDANAPDSEERSFMLCSECKKVFYYVMENPMILDTHVSNMSLKNRIRFLFKRGLKNEE